MFFLIKKALYFLLYICYFNQNPGKDNKCEIENRVRFFIENIENLKILRDSITESEKLKKMQFVIKQAASFCLIFELTFLCF